MESCWALNPEERPTFLTLYLQLEALLDHDAEYIYMDEVFEHVYESLQH